MKQPVKPLNPQNVPLKFQHLIPYAEEWGIIDDGARDKYINNASRSILQTLVTEVSQYDEILDEWLAGPETEANPPSIEYVVFSCLRLAVDIAILRLTQIK